MAGTRLDLQIMFHFDPCFVSYHNLIETTDHLTGGHVT